MNSSFTHNTQAILLLTAPLIFGRSTETYDLLTPGEYNRLARFLRESQLQPADLVGPRGPEAIGICSGIIPKERLESLLQRGFLLSQAIEHWSARSIWVVGRADATYPRRLKARLKEEAPAVIYGCGDSNLLEKGGLAVVGSRHVDEELLNYTAGIGRLAALAGRSIVSGGAKGIDRAAMQGALTAGGNAVGVLSDSLERAALGRDNREPLIDRNLVLISPYDPSAGFNVGHAMQRNKLVYALSDAAFVVSSDLEKGGTWTGAIEQIDRFRFVPLFVRKGDGVGKGNEALLQRGALRWPEPTNPAELVDAVFSAKMAEKPAEPHQETLLFALRETAPPMPGQDSLSVAPIASPPSPPAVQATAVAEQLFNTVRAALPRQLGHGMTEPEIADVLQVTKGQAKMWLTRLLAEGCIEKVKKTKPTKYRSLGERLI